MDLLKAIFLAMLGTAILALSYAITACFQAVVIATPLYFGLYFIMAGDAPLTYPEFGRIVLLFTGMYNLYNLIDVINNTATRQWLIAKRKYNSREMR